VGANKKKPIWKFIPLKPRYGEERALPGTKRTFTQILIYHRGIWLSMGKFWRPVECFEDSAGSCVTRFGDTPRGDASYSSIRSERVLQVK
jgi:hypothetical protein